MLSLKPVGWLLLVLPLLGLTCHYGYEAYLVDACLDSGGSFDFEAMSCDAMASHPPIPYWRRHGVAIVTSLGISLVGFLITYTRHPAKK